MRVTLSVTFLSGLPFRRTPAIRSTRWYRSRSGTFLADAPSPSPTAKASGFQLKPADRGLARSGSGKTSIRFALEWNA